MYTDAQKKSHIRELQGYLYQLGRQDNRIPLVIPDGVYGPETALAVRAFQEIHQLPVTGEVNRTTWDAIVADFQAQTAPPLAIDAFPSPTYVLREGDEGSLVFFVQVMLDALHNRHGDLPPVDVNGHFDHQTAEAVRALQHRAGAHADGRVDRNTWNALVMGYLI